MNRRSEPRLKVYSRAVVTLTESPEREFVCSLTDISAAGFKLLSSEALPRGATAAVEVEDHLILAEIKHSEERGAQFAVGIQRLHTLAKRALPEDSTTLEKTQALITDFHRQGAVDRALKGLFSDDESVPEARPPASVPALPKLGIPTRAHFAAVHPIAFEKAIEVEQGVLESGTLDPCTFESKTLKQSLAIPTEEPATETSVEIPEEFDSDLFAWADKHREANTRHLLEEQKRLIRSRNMMFAIVAGAAIIALEALLLIVLIPRGHIHQSNRAPVVDSAPQDLSLQR